MTTSHRRPSLGLGLVVIGVALANWAWLLAALPTFSNAGLEVLPSYLILIPGAGVLAVAQLVVLWYANLRRPVPARWALAAGSAGAILSTVCWSTDWDFRCRLWLSADGLQRVADEALRQPPNFVRDDGEAGLFRISRYYRSDDTVVFITGHGFKNPYGVIYVPPGANRPQDARHVFGPWYQYP